MAKRIKKANPKHKRKAIWIIEDSKLIQKRPRICDQHKFKPFWNSEEEAKKNLPRKAIWVIEDGVIVQKRPRICDHDQFNPHWTSLEKAQAAISLDYTLTRGSLSIFYNDQTITVTASDKRYQKLRAACREEDINAIFRLANLSSVLETETTAFQMKGDKVLLDGDELPRGLSQKVVNALKTDDTASLENFWKRLKKNPDKRVRANLYEFMAANGMTISKDGFILAYKYVKKDFTDDYTGKFDFSPGKTPKMPREKCNSDPTVACSTGLHVGTWHYSGKYGTVLLVKVDPCNVVSVPNDYNCHKMRCCEVTSVKQVKQPLNDTEVATLKELAA